MSLRWRLTLLFASLLGGVVLLFGGLAYGMMSLLLLNHVDEMLVTTSVNLLDQMRVDINGQLIPDSLADYQPLNDQVLQIWDTSARLIYSNPPSVTALLDHGHAGFEEPSFRTVQYQGIPLRVLHMPLTSSRAPFGVMDIGMPLSFVEQARQTLAGVLSVLGIIFIVASIVVAQALIRKTQEPLHKLTEMVKLITTSKDLSRRVPMPDNAHDEVGLLVTAFNETLERLEGLFRSQRRLLSDVSHELRTPLTVIKGNLSLMQQQGCTDPESMHSIQLEVERLNRLVGDLLLLGQVETGGLRLNIGKVQLADLVLEVVAQLNGMNDKGVDLKVSTIDMIAVEADRDRLKQVLLNLGSNAMQYSGAQGKVRFALRRDEDGAVVDVIDNGPGIAQQDLEHIFERFYRGERSRTRSQGVGYGLGLSIAERIVKAHDGQLTVKSVVGEGSTFSVHLPLTHEAAEA